LSGLTPFNEIILKISQAAIGDQDFRVDIPLMIIGLQYLSLPIEPGEELGAILGEEEAADPAGLLQA